MENLKNELNNMQLEEKKIMKLVDLEYDIEYNLQLIKENDKIHFILKETKVFVPFTFEGYFSLDDFIKRHIGFKSCDNLDDVLKHLFHLYNNNKISINDLGYEQERYLFLMAWNISEEFQSEHFALARKMTENKDEDLLHLYKIQKNEIKLLKDIKSMIEEKLSHENPIYQNIIKILKDSDI